MTTAPTLGRPRACLLTAAALTAAILITAAMPRSAQAQDSSAEAGPQADAAALGTGNRCARLPPGFGHPPASLTPLGLQVLQRSVEPVPATDGLIHLAYVAQATNTQATQATILSVVPVDPLARFTPTGNNLIIDEQGRSVAGKVKLFVTSPDNIPPDDGPEAEPPTAFSTAVPAGNSGLMFFDVTYTDPAQIPRLLGHAITLASPDGNPGAAGLTDPVPVGCRALAVVHPPLVGQGWTAFNGCCIYAAYHRVAVPPVNGILQAGQQFAIDYIQLGPDDTCCHGPVTAVTSWYGYGTPVLAAAPGIVAAVLNGMPDQEPVGTITPLPPAKFTGNSIIEYIGAGQYALYAHLMPKSIPASIRQGARLVTGAMIGRVGNSGNSGAPHLHFQLMDNSSFADATGLPFVFDTQLLDGSVPEGAVDELVQGAPVTIDRTATGRRLNQMPARNGVFSYNVPQ